MTSFKTPSTSGNRTLESAAKQDEFYTQLADIENELKHYKHHFKRKVVLCNRDDPFESNFFKYFAANCNALRLKKLVCTSYDGSPIVGSQLPLMGMEGLKPYGKKELYLVEINEVPDLNSDGAIGPENVEPLIWHEPNSWRKFKGNDLYGADVAVTNPPFSLFRGYVAQFVEHGKQFLIIGSMNTITYKEVFKVIKEKKLYQVVS